MQISCTVQVPGDLRVIDSNQHLVHLFLLFVRLKITTQGYSQDLQD